MNILWLTDIHLGFKNINTIFEEVTFPKIKYIFLLGDFDNLTREDQNNAEKLEMNKKNIFDILKIIKEKFPQIIILLIPGNHDSKELFDKKIDWFKDDPFVHNIHLSQFKLKNNLYVLGFGGSSSILTYKNSVKKIVSQGFPYDNENKMNLDLKYCREFINNTIDENPKAKFILMTHNGPFSSLTCICKSKENKGNNIIDPIINNYLNENYHIYGSIELENFFIENKKHIILNIHGHCHNAISFHDFFINIPIHNPRSVIQENNLTVLSIDQKNDIFNFNFNKY